MRWTLVPLAAFAVACGSEPAARKPPIDPHAEAAPTGDPCDAVFEESAPDARPGDRIALVCAGAVAKGGELRGDPTRFTRDLETRAGAAFDEAVVAEDIQRLWRLGAVDDVEVRAAGGARGVVVRFGVRPRKALAAVRVEGVTKQRADAIVDRVAGGAMALDVARVRSVVATIEDEAHGAGFLRAKASYRIEDGPDGAIVTITVADGERATVRALAFHGLAALREGELAAKLASRPGGSFDPEVLQQDVTRIQAAALEVGLVEVKVEPSIRAAPDGSSVDIDVTVVEGTPYRLSKIVFTGALSGRKAHFQKLLVLKAGDVFVRSKLLEGLEKMRVETGLLVDPQTTLDRKKHTIEVAVHVGD